MLCCVVLCCVGLGAVVSFGWVLLCRLGCLLLCRWVGCCCVVVLGAVVSLCWVLLCRWVGRCCVVSFLQLDRRELRIPGLNYAHDFLITENFFIFQSVSPLTLSRSLSYLLSRLCAIWCVIRWGGLGWCGVAWSCVVVCCVVLCVVLCCIAVCAVVCWVLWCVGLCCVLCCVVVCCVALWYVVLRVQHVSLRADELCIGPEDLAGAHESGGEYGLPTAFALAGRSHPERSRQEQPKRCNH